MTVLHGTCGEVVAGSGYGGVRALFGPLGLTADDAHDSPLLQGSARRALPALAPSPAPRSPASPATVYPVLHGLYWLAVNLMAHGPLVLVLDDAHWCDERSLRWIDFLLRRADRPAAAAWCSPSAPRRSPSPPPRSPTSPPSPAPRRSGSAPLTDADVGRDGPADLPASPVPRRPSSSAPRPSAAATPSPRPAAAASCGPRGRAGRAGRDPRDRRGGPVRGRPVGARPVRAAGPAGSATWPSPIAVLGEEEPGARRRPGRGARRPRRGGRGGCCAAPR